MQATSAASSLLQEFDLATIHIELNHQPFSVPINVVNQVVRLPVLTPVPGSKPWLLGVANIHNCIVPIVHLGQFLRLSEASISPNHRLLLCSDNKDHPVGFLVDHVAGFSEKTLRPAPQAVLERQPDNLKPFLSGLCGASPDELNLSIEQIMEHPDFCAPQQRTCQTLR